MLIRTEAPSDILAIDHLLREVSLDSVVADRVMKLRENGQRTLAIVACNDSGEVIGFVMFSPVTLNDEEVNKIKYNKFYQLNEQISYKVKKTAFFTNSSLNNNYKFQLLPQKSTIDKYRSRLKIESVKLNSTIIDLSLTYSSSPKAVDILNTLIINYNKDAKQDKNQISIGTTNFINDRIKILTSELKIIEDSLESIKIANHLIDYKFESQNKLAQNREIQDKYINANMQLVLAQNIKDHITKNKGVEDLAPVNLGITDPYIEQSITEHNKLVLKRLELLRKSTDKNPNVVELTNKIIEPPLSSF